MFPIFNETWVPKRHHVTHWERREPPGGPSTPTRENVDIDLNWEFDPVLRSGGITPGGPGRYFLHQETVGGFTEKLKPQQPLLPQEDKELERGGALHAPPSWWGSLVLPPGRADGLKVVQGNKKKEVYISTKFDIFRPTEK